MATRRIHDDDVAVSFRSGKPRPQSIRRRRWHLEPLIALRSASSHRSCCLKRPGAPRCTPIYIPPSCPSSRPGDRPRSCCNDLHYRDAQRCDAAPWSGASLNKNNMQFYVGTVTAPPRPGRGHGRRRPAAARAVHHERAPPWRPAGAPARLGPARHGRDALKAWRDQQCGGRHGVIVADLCTASNTQQASTARHAAACALPYIDAAHPPRDAVRSAATLNCNTRRAKLCSICGVSGLAVTAAQFSPLRTAACQRSNTVCHYRLRSRSKLQAATVFRQLPAIPMPQRTSQQGAAWRRQHVDGIRHAGETWPPFLDFGMRRWAMASSPTAPPQGPKAASVGRAP